jgi:hypothetical protein
VNKTLVKLKKDTPMKFVGTKGNPKSSTYVRLGTRQESSEHLPEKDQLLIEHCVNHYRQMHEALQQVVDAFVTKERYPDFTTNSEEFIRLATIETRARLALSESEKLIP